MAENKKSFVLYCDLLNTVNKLPDSKAGKLFKIILEYVNDNNPTIKDLLIDVTFEPIKNQLKRDLIKYEEKRGEKSTSGKLGNLKRYYLDIYNKVVSDEITLEAGLRLAKTRKDSQSDTKLAVNDTVTVNDISYIDFLKENHSTQLEQMRMKLRGINEKDFFIFFENKCVLEDIPFKFQKINARFNLLLSNWNKDTKETPKVLKLKDVGL